MIYTLLLYNKQGLANDEHYTLLIVDCVFSKPHMDTPVFNQFSQPLAVHLCFLLQIYIPGNNLTLFSKYS